VSNGPHEVSCSKDWIMEAWGVLQTLTWLHASILSLGSSRAYSKCYIIVVRHTTCTPTTALVHQHRQHMCWQTLLLLTSRRALSTAR
jgi:hypothetical protein